MPLTPMVCLSVRPRRAGFAAHYVGVRAGLDGWATVRLVPEFKLPLYGSDTERGDAAPWSSRSA